MRNDGFRQGSTYLTRAIEQKIEEALSKEDPIESMKTLAIKLNNEGINKEEIVQAFHAVDNMLKNANKDREIDLLEDVIDMITGYYVGENLNLK